MSEKISQLPRHVAIIMDGNGRWAQEHSLTRSEGHNRGALNARTVITAFQRYGIPYLTLYVFSTENWGRPPKEIDGIMKLLIANLDNGIAIARENNIKIRHLGSIDGLPKVVKDKIQEAINVTAGNSSMTLSLAFNFGSRDEIVRAVRRIVEKGIEPKHVDENTVSKYLFTAGVPDPDLIIRTGGDMRLSNFLLWQAAYAEIYSTPVLWPDFGEQEIEAALMDYNRRQRRFGKLQES
jgi:undecaprenyl diphosphate synthase